MMTSKLMRKAAIALKEHWGHEDFYKYQQAVVEPALEGNDVIAVLPTGAGKSVCFQVPALIVPGGAIVVSPLIALMKDQVDGCKRRGVPAGCLHSNMDDAEREETLSEFVSGSLRLLYIAPERIGNRAFMERITQATVSFIVADEAHCVSSWGHEFRPDYMRISRLVQALTNRDGTRPPILALTATATTLVMADIRQSLGMRDDAVTVTGDPVRPNLQYITDPPGSMDRQFGQWVDALDVSVGHHIIYANTRRKVEQLAEKVNEYKGPGVAVAYHAGMTPDQRTQTQDEFVEGGARVICATTAFGMGVDIPDIRTVINYGIPSSIEAFVQQSGRAGRDGQMSKVVLLNDEWNTSFQITQVENNNPPLALYEVVWEWLHDELGSPTKKLQMSMAEIATRITARRRMSVQEEQVRSVLGVMHSNGVAERRGVEGGIPVVIDAVGFDALVRGKHGATVTPTVREVARALWKYSLADAALAAQAGETVEAIVNKEGVARASGHSTYMINKVIERLRAVGVVKAVKPPFRGSVVRILPDAWRGSISELLPMAKIEEKRRSDLARLHAMIRYTYLRSEPERKAAIRAYFLPPDSK